MQSRFAALIAFTVVLAGCGQKGPLYLPDKGGEVVTRPGGGPTQQQAPQSPSQSGTTEEERKRNQQNSQSPQTPPN